MYWIQERYRIRTKKEAGDVAPWSDDPVFQTTYFCNVHREDDKVTRFIRQMYSRHVGHPLFEYNMVAARFLNWPKTLEGVGYIEEHDPDGLYDYLKQTADAGFQIWGGAYVITTHGQKMEKAKYLTHQVLEDVHKRIESVRVACRGVGQGARCATASAKLQEIDGIGSFLAAQVVADLKNTPGHPLQTAVDWWSFVEPGPGSMRGIDWICFEAETKTTPRNFHSRFMLIRAWVDAHWPADIPKISNQDLQNCLCEFDKYCRVATATGRSKRKYNGSGT